MRRVHQACALRGAAFVRQVAVAPSWASQLPPPSDPRYEELGKQIIQKALPCDTGREAFQECFLAKRQLETIIRSCGYDMSVHPFGGVAIMGFLESGGDADFVGVSDVEPDFAEASEIIQRLTREMRRLGMRATAVPKARVPVVKVDRTSRVAPGSPLHPVASTAIFQLSGVMSAEDRHLFEERLKDNFDAKSIEWDASGYMATISFGTTSKAVEAIARVKRHGSIDIPFRLPADPRNGPELFRYPFDLCLSSTGLRNSCLLAEYMGHYAFSRHLLLALKRWGRSSGVVNTYDGLLASYAITVMCVHFLSVMDVIPTVSVDRLSDEPLLLPRDPPYRPLQTGDGGDLARLGYLFASFFEYFGTVFDYKNSVVCTTNLKLSKKTLRWDVSPGDVTGRPPFFNLSIKDPYGLDNVARNLDSSAVEYVRESFSLGLRAIVSGLDDVPPLMHMMINDAPRPEGSHRQVSSYFKNRASQRAADEDIPKAGHLSAAELKEHDEALYLLKKLELAQRREGLDTFGKSASQRSVKDKAAQDVAKVMTGWLREDQNAR